MRIIWSVPAEDDLRALNDWLTREASPGYAVRTLVAIRSRAKFLEDFPHGGRPHRDETRVLRVFDTPYLLRYQIIDDIVSVLRLHHERENWFVNP